MYVCFVFNSVVVLFYIQLQAVRWLIYVTLLHIISVNKIWWLKVIMMLCMNFDEQLLGGTGTEESHILCGGQ